MTRRRGGRGTDVESLRRELSAAIADEERLYQRYHEHLREGVRWAERARLAAVKGRDDMARLALERQRLHERLTEVFKAEYHQQGLHVARLKRRWLLADALTMQAKRVPFPRRRSIERDRARELIAALQLDADPIADRLKEIERIERVEQQLAALKAKLRPKGAEGA